jgi:hypothetical protein
LLSRSGCNRSSGCTLFSPADAFLTRKSHHVFFPIEFFLVEFRLVFSSLS